MILGFGISGYRSFGSALQRVGPCRKINLIIGQNNSGKSNILKFIHDHYPKLAQLTGASSWALKDLERFRTKDPLEPAATVAFDWKAHAQWLQQVASPVHQQQLEQFLGALRSENPCGSGFWFDLAFPQISSAQSATEFLQRHSGLQAIVRNLCLNVAGGASSNENENLRRLTSWIFQRLFVPPNCVTIPGLRNPGRSEVKLSDFSGADIIHRVAQLQNPQHHQQERKEDFHRIVRFLQRVTDNPDAQLEIPYDRDTITVHMDGRSMPLEALGTGIHEVIILAAAATSLHQNVICIEEPEVHLHPLLQKKLLRYLENETDNQYFISTHSAHLLDHPNAAIFHVQLTAEGSSVDFVTEPAQRFAICTDLGYRASDLLQTNCIVWVEGPSDRIYIRAWLRLVDPKLVEGVDYSIMFYGGRLLSHLSPDDPDVEDFISLRLLNRNMVIVMDSDRDKPGKRLNATKLRIQDEWRKHPGFVWVTNGREIENYVSPDEMLRALRALAPGKKHRRPKSLYEKSIAVTRSGSPLADKVKVAHWLAEHGDLALETPDLKRQVERLAGFIRQSNHQPAA